jgi:hypothetical protein
MKLRFHWVLPIPVLAVAAAALIGCGQKAATPVSTAIGDPVVAPSAGAVEDRVAAAVRNAFASDVGVAAQSVGVTGIQETTWNDSSLGCPGSGQSYAEVLTPGYQVTVQSGEVSAVYHTDKPEGDVAPHVVRCDQGAALPGSASLGGPALEKANADLADRLGGGAEITVEEQQVAPVGDLVCDQDTAGATPSSGPRRVILEFHLKSGDTTYVYRSWGNDILYCGTTEDLIIE